MYGNLNELMVWRPLDSIYYAIQLALKVWYRGDIETWDILSSFGFLVQKVWFIVPSCVSQVGISFTYSTKYFSESTNSQQVFQCNRNHRQNNKKSNLNKKSQNKLQPSHQIITVTWTGHTNKMFIQSIIIIGPN